MNWLNILKKWRLLKLKWFKHLSDMRNDPKIKRLLRKYGVTGYGLYTYIIECISSNLDSNKPLPDLEETADDLAYELKIESKLVEEIVTYCVDEKLFTVDAISNRIVCGKIYKFLDDTTRKSPEIAKMIEGFKNIIGNSEKVGLIPSNSENVHTDIDIELEEDIEKNEKKKEKELKKETAKKVIDYLNKKTGKKFRYGDANLKHIIARINEKFELSDFCKVVDLKIKDPHFIENPQYLSPDTLFGSKFEKYLNSGGVKDTSLKTETLGKEYQEWSPHD